MKIRLYNIVFACVVIAASLSCSESNEYYGAPPIRQPEPKEVEINGRVATESGYPLAGVAVSDGITVVSTDTEGRFSFMSPLTMGYVFVSTPDGYEPSQFLDNRPKFWQEVSRKECTGIEFKLRQIADKKPLSIIAIADPQISNRCGDVELLRNFYVPEINRAIDSLRTNGTSPIVLTLGDIICDWFVANGYGYTLDKFNSDFQVNAPVYHTMGNHDNDPFIAGDMAGSSTWHKINGPSYYSFNRGGAHFISVDNIVYINDGAGNGVAGNRNCDTAIPEQQLKWIAADLATVQDKDAPLFIMMHGILLTYPVAEGQTVNKVYRFDDGGPQLGELLKDFTNVKVLSGHSHKSHFQHTPEGNIREYNYAGTNGGWWPAGFTPYKANFPVCFDGAPWGMGIWDFSAGPQPSHLYKGYGSPTDFQIRAYDLNKVVIDDRDITTSFLPGASGNSNVVMANVWAYEPGCTVKMFENGVELDVKRVKSVDPYLILKYILPVKQEYGKMHSGIEPESTAHIFRAKASTSDAPVTIEFKDLYGRTYTTVLNRPADI